MKRFFLERSTTSCHVSALTAIATKIPRLFWWVVGVVVIVVTTMMVAKMAIMYLQDFFQFVEKATALS